MISEPQLAGHCFNRLSLLITTICKLVVGYECQRVTYPFVYSEHVPIELLDGCSIVTIYHSNVSAVSHETV